MSVAPSPVAAAGDPICIVGIGCRFPKAHGPEAFWSLLSNGVDAISRMPAERFEIDAVYDPRPGVPGKLSSLWGGFLDTVETFDPYFFGIAPREAERMDPQQRLVLETAWEAIEDAGLIPSKLADTQTGVFMASCYHDYDHLQLETPEQLDVYASTGAAQGVIAGRLSYVLDLRGPSIAVDSACASSLVALHLACESLRSGESDLALAGGVNVMLAPEVSIGFARAGMLAPDGRCKFGSARANGFVRSEGVAVLVLKRLGEARRDGDPIYAVIRGSAVNNDGRSSGLMMTPGRQGQEAVLRRAYEVAGVSPRAVRYIEAHGTGTTVGDPIELEALGAVLGAARAGEAPLRVGSVKSNIGHTEAAAGIAGVIKVALALRHGALPASLHAADPNPSVPWEKLGLVLQRELGPWPAGARIAGVSALGINGTNAHVVLEEAPEADHAEPAALPRKSQLLVLSAKSASALPRVASAHAAFLRNEGPRAPALPDVCFTASARRAYHEHRLAVAGSSPAELAERLDAFAGGQRPPGVASGAAVLGHRPKVVFVFPGQGSQWLGMGRSLFAQEPAFRALAEACDRAFRPHVEWSFLDELHATPERSRLDQVDVIQPAIFAMQVGIAGVLAEWGIVPDAVVGHSLGEVAAAYVAGALCLEDAARVICQRSLLVKSTSGQGGMMLVELSFAEAAGALAGFEDRVAVAASNGPTSSILSGELGALTTISERLTARDVFWRWIKVDYASHSAQMDPLRPRLLETLAGLAPRAPQVRMVSTVLPPGDDSPRFDEVYWVRNLREPVRFWQAVNQLSSEGHEVFVELSPHPVLGGMVEVGLRGIGRTTTMLATLRREEDEQAALMATAGALHVLGVTPDWHRLNPVGGRCVSLPTYPFEREVFPVDAADGCRRRRAALPTDRDVREHPLLGPHVASAAHAGTHLWQTALGADAPGYLKDHCVGEDVLLPAAAFLEMARAAAHEAVGSEVRAIERVAFLQALVLPKEGRRSVEVVISPSVHGRAALRFYSRVKSDESWELHATAEARIAELGAADHESPSPFAAAEAKARCAEEQDAETYYATLARHGLRYGPAFQGIERVWRGDGEALARVRLPVSAGSVGDYGIHPALLDAGLQLFLAAMPASAVRSPTDTFLPATLASFRLHQRAGVAAWAHARMSSAAQSGGVEGDVCLYDEQGAPLVEARGLRCVRLAEDASRDPKSWLYAPAWRRVAAPTVPGPSAKPRGPWLILADRGGLGAALAARVAEHGQQAVVVTAGARFQTNGGRYEVDPRRAEDFRSLLASASESGVPPFRAVVHLWSLDVPSGPENAMEPLGVALELGCLSTLHLVQALTRDEMEPRLWLITRGAVATGREPQLAVAQAPLWGMGRTIAHEHPELSCTRVDLDPAVSTGDVDALVRELLQDSDEVELALRGDARLAGRIACWPSAAAPVERELARDRPFRMERPASGILTEIGARACALPVAPAGEVVIDVRAAGLNFADVLSAMGIYPGQTPDSSPFGLECAGVVSAVGAGVTGVHVGEQVIAITPPPRVCLGSHVVADARFVFPMPAHMSFEAAAALPIAYLTTYHAFHLARLEAGERVLIHAAAGGVGLAAVQLARHAGATIFATAGSEEKRAYLASLGIQHVMDSRSLAFVDEVLERTGGAGVDVLLNSLAGEALSRGLDVLAPYGRFVEIGKRDIYENSHIGLWPLRKNAAFFVIDIQSLLKERPDVSARHMRATLALLEERKIEALPVRSFPAADIAEAFEHFRQAKNIGKVVVTMERDKLTLASRAPEAPRIRADATYFLTGGMGALGLKVARWLIDKGARHLLLAGRRATEEARQAIADLAAEAEVEVVQVDVADREALRAVLDSASRRMPPLRGVIHCAGLLQDGVITKLDEARLRAVMRPKIDGAWNLHVLTASLPLDLFVLFSSAASLLGSPGQANYSAANAFLDALAHHRRARGLPALSINWGPWSEVGLAAAQTNRGERLVSRGIDSMTPEEGLAVLDRLLRAEATQVGALQLDAARWFEFNPHVARSSLVSELRVDAGAGGGAQQEQGVVSALSGLPPGPERRALLESTLRNHAAQVLRLGRERIDPRKSLGNLGLDSLMAVELRNRLEATFRLRLPVTAIWNYPNIEALAVHIGERIGLELTSPASGDRAEPPSPRDDTAELAVVLEAAAASDEDEHPPTNAASARGAPDPLDSGLAVSPVSAEDA